MSQFPCSIHLAGILLQLILRRFSSFAPCATHTLKSFLSSRQKKSRNSHADYFTTKKKIIIQNWHFWYGKMNVIALPDYPDGFGTSQSQPRSQPNFIGEISKNHNLWTDIDVQINQFVLKLTNWTNVWKNKSNKWNSSKYF